MKHLSKTEIVEVFRRTVNSSVLRRILDDGSVRILGLFRGACGSRAFVVIRSVNFVAGRRLVTLMAMGDTPHGTDAGMIPDITWSSFVEGSRSDVDDKVIARLKAWQAKKEAV